MGREGISGTGGAVNGRPVGHQPNCRQAGALIGGCSRRGREGRGAASTDRLLLSAQHVWDPFKFAKTYSRGAVAQQLETWALDSNSQLCSLGKIFNSLSARGPIC